ncbi:hypothetical protein E0F15_11155 [Frankia sp. B2]|uniref:hypothetical protein n=1 Tax=Frankia sp. B2 TaxID=2541730 RepID=UPI001068F44E|nr:hypothetical protein [Frankia sp. B2]TFE31032.1 hypothetical protein E0F15_11155 [Frankia sp. B2]
MDADGNADDAAGLPGACDDPAKTPVEEPWLHHRVLVTLRQHGDLVRLGVPPAAQVTPYFPDGCPETAPPGWLADNDYLGPHGETVCPACIDSWRRDHRVSEPVPVTDGIPLFLVFPWPVEVDDLIEDRTPRG